MLFIALATSMAIFVRSVNRIQSVQVNTKFVKFSPRTEWNARFKENILLKLKGVIKKIRHQSPRNWKEWTSSAINERIPDWSKNYVSAEGWHHACNQNMRSRTERLKRHFIYRDGVTATRRLHENSNGIAAPVHLSRSFLCRFSVQCLKQGKIKK